MSSSLHTKTLFLLLLSSLLVNHPAAAERSLEELARLFSRYQEGTSFQLSPEGDRFVARMPKDGAMGAMVFDVSDPSTGLSKGVFLAPDSKYEINPPMWIDNDKIGYGVAAFDSYVTGYNIDRVEPGKKTSSRFSDSPWSGNYQRGFFRTLYDGLPSTPDMFLSEESEFKEGRRFYSNMVLLELTRHMNVNEEKRWVNPGNFDRWIFRNLEPYAIQIDDDQFTMDFSLLTDYTAPSIETLVKSMKPLDLPGYLAGFVGDVAILLVDSEDEDKKGVALYNPDSGKFFTKPLFAGDYSLMQDSASILQYRSGGNIAGVLYHTDKPNCHYYDSGIEGIMKQLESMVSNGIPIFQGLSKDNRFLYYEIRSDTRDSTYMRLDLQTGNSEMLYAVRPWIAELELPPREPVSFENRDGQTIHGYMILPKTYKKGSPVPLVALSHGGPWVRDTWGFDEEAQFYASLGYAVLQVNYRGSTGYGEAYGLDENLIAISEASPKDVIDGVRWAIDAGYADKDKIAFVGASYGAYLSLFCSALAPDLPACAIGFAGVYDWELAYEADSEDEMPFVEDMYEDFEEKQDRYRELSPVRHASKIKAPILIVHGGKDARVGYRQADAMARALEAAGAKYELVKRRFLLHGYPNEEYKYEHYVMVGEFLQRHLGK